MKAMLTAFVAIGLISVGAWYALHEIGFGTGEVNAGPDVRLGDADE
ncbi:hypothetical protein [Roseovarius aestuariivivens]|nr:hypothetical protein [Roseovarius aestuariivivens]